MRELPTNICPLLAIASIGSTSGPAVCVKDRCALFSFVDSKCALLAIADAIREASGI